jgi:tetratricopeptide (TPR) repeat protein
VRGEGTQRDPTVTSPDRRAEALGLVQAGWAHLQVQRPLAAWASWNMALRRVPDFPPAAEALATLASAPDLPAAATVVRRFSTPRDAERRARWDRLFQGKDLAELDQAASAFASLAAEDRDDADAAYNEGLCLAWLGRNADAVAALDRAVVLTATAGDPGFERAVDAWTLAEVLRHGAGAESLADDFRYSWVIDECDPEVFATRLGEVAVLVPLAAPIDPDLGLPGSDATVFEWLDRPFNAPTAGEPGLAGLPRLLATLIVARRSRTLRISSPDPKRIEGVHEPLGRAIGPASHRIRREAMPLPLILLDAAVWTFRFPPGWDAETRDRLARGAVESYFENEWIHVPRKGLAGRTPLEASRSAAVDPVIRAKLTAVVRLREQLGRRPRTAALYQGYPFDRLRRRLGLELDEPSNVDPDDVACQPEAELDRIDHPDALDDARLTEVFESAAGLGDDRRTVRFASVLARRASPHFTRLDLEALIAPLVRESLRTGRPEEALAWLRRGLELDAGPGRRTFTIWSAEVHARAGEPEAALTLYQELLGEAPVDPVLALDSAETMLDNGHDEHARRLLRVALEAGGRHGDSHTAGRAKALLEALSS